VRLILAAAERTVAALLFLLVSPLLIALCAAVWLLSGRSPLVAIRRVGQHGAPLRMLKLRTMWPRERTGWTAALMERIENEPVPAMKRGRDPRVTSALGCFCRRHSLDEWPQLLHVVAGEMSLVGPRPLTGQELDAYYGAEAAQVLQVKPGLTGLWQTRGRSRLTYHQRKRLDLFLARHRSARLYADILWRTLPCVWSGRDAW